MPIFGLVWVTSWVSYLLASSQGLLKVPDYLASVFPAKVFSVVSSPIEIPSPLFQPSLSPKVWSSNSADTVLPHFAFQTSTGSSLFRPPQVQAASRPPVQPVPIKNTFCRPEAEKEATLPVTTPLSSSAASWRESSVRDAPKATFPQQILQVMQNLLPWRQRAEPLGKAVAASVRVVSPHVLEQVGEKNNSEGRRVKRGFWQYSQRLARRAFAAEFPTAAGEQEQFQVWVKGRIIAHLPKQQQAERMAQRLKQVFYHLSDLDLNASQIEVAFVEGFPVVKLGDRFLFNIDDALAKDLDRNGELLAVEWANNLRSALGKEPLQLAEAQRRMYNLVETQTTFEGLASWYAPYFHGRVTATGEIYNQHELTAAHPSLPFDTYLKVRNLENDEAVIVRINDRGPFVSDKNRNLDLSREAARCLKGEKLGIMPFEAVIMRSPSGN
jgi:rare lipoprotein A